MWFARFSGLALRLTDAEVAELIRRRGGLSVAVEVRPDAIAARAAGEGDGIFFDAPVVCEAVKMSIWLDGSTAMAVQEVGKLNRKCGMEG